MERPAVKYPSGVYVAALSFVMLFWSWSGTVLAHGFDTSPVNDSVVRVSGDPCVCSMNVPSPVGAQRRDVPDTPVPCR